MAHLLILCGVPGAGKSTLVRYLCDTILHNKKVIILDPDSISLSDPIFPDIAKELNISLDFFAHNFEENFTAYNVEDFATRLTLINKYIERKIIDSLKNDDIVILSRPMSNKNNFFDLLKIINENVPSATVDILQLQVSYRVAATRVKRRVLEGKNPLFYVPLKYYYKKCKEVNKFLCENLNVKKLYRNYWTAETYKNKSYDQLVILLRDNVFQQNKDSNSLNTYNNSNIHSGSSL